MTDPAAERTLPRLVEAAVRRYGARSAIEDGELRLSYSELGEAALAASRAFLGAGLEPGDRVAIWAPNIAEWVVAAIGLQSVGGVLVPISTRYKGAEAEHVLVRSGARWLLSVAGFLDTDYVGMLAGRELPALERRVVLRGEAAGAEAWSDFLRLGEAVPAQAVRERAAAVRPEDRLDMLFTSGTTGKPKGVLTTHGQNLAVFDTFSASMGLREGDRYLVVAPFFHAFGYKAGWLSAIQRGATILPHAVFEAEAVLERIERERIHVLPGPPAIYQSLLAAPGLARADLSSLRLALTGASAVPVELVRRMREELGFESVLTAYGLTETCGLVSMCRSGDDPETVARTTGRPVPGVEVKVMDPEAGERAPGEPGEIWVRGPNVMEGYFEAPEQTAAAIDSEGWLHTGDIGVLDERGYLRITDRLGDMFIVGGFNCYPAEIEGRLFERDDVAQAAVIGIPDPRLGEVGMAFVVPMAGRRPDPDEVRSWCAEQMANFKVPRRIEIVEALPLNATGKVDKQVLRAWAADPKAAGP